jgi:dihydropteroate synthase
MVLDRPIIIGIVNVTPDSFSDGGRFDSARHAADVAIQMIRDGADGVDVGGESTRPGAKSVSTRAQIKRTAEVIRLIREDRRTACASVSIDTTRAKVAEAALDAGADAINDVSAGMDDPAMFRLAAKRRCGLILMHRLARPDADVFSHDYAKGAGPAAPVYRDVVHEVGQFLAERAVRAMKAGVKQDAIVLDPGLGFGKTVEQNLELIARTGELAELGYPIMSGLSRKSFIAGAAQAWAGEREPRHGVNLSELPPVALAPASERLAGTLALSALHLRAGASLFRVHDVGAHVQALRCALGAMRAGQSAPER